MNLNLKIIGYFYKLLEYFLYLYSMKIHLKDNQKGILWNIMEKYENIFPDFSDSINRVILNKFTNDDIILISQYMDMSLDNIDSKILDKLLGVQIGLVCFQL